jgi:hypothetical protein
MSARYSSTLLNDPISNRNELPVLVVASIGELRTHYPCHHPDESHMSLNDKEFGRNSRPGMLRRRGCVVQLARSRLDFARESGATIE